MPMRRSHSTFSTHFAVLPVPLSTRNSSPVPPKVPFINSLNSPSLKVLSFYPSRKDIVQLPFRSFSFSFCCNRRSFSIISASNDSSPLRREQNKEFSTRLFHSFSDKLLSDHSRYNITTLLYRSHHFDPFRNSPRQSSNIVYIDG